MKKILFPTDFSVVSRNAFIYALKLAENLGAEIVTLHVYDLPTLSAGGMPNTIKEVYDSIELENFENYKDEIPFLREIAQKNGLGHIPVSNILKHGDFVWTLNHVAKDEKVDLIVMGTDGASGLKEIFVGSMSGSVLVESNANVLIVPQKGEYKEIKHIAFTTRFRDKDIIALKDVLEIAHAFKAKVHCLYVKTTKSDVSEETIKQWSAINNCGAATETAQELLTSIPGEDLSARSYNCGAGSLEFWSIPQGVHTPALDINFAEKVIAWLLQFKA